MYDTKDIRTCSEDEKLTQLAELKGQLIDVFEDFLDSRGIVIPNPERDEDEDLDPDEAANIYGSDYDELAEGLMKTLEKWGLMESELSIDTPAGKLIAYAGRDLDNPSVGIYFKPLNGGEVDLAMAEVQSKVLCEGTDVGEKDVVLYKWEDLFSEDYTSKTVLREKDIKQALD